MVQSLLDRGVEVNLTSKTFETPLHLACHLGSRSIVEGLLARGADPNAFCGRFETPLITALESNHPLIAELLLQKGADVNYHSPKYGTALHYACSPGGLAVVQMLLRRGANATTLTDSHGSPFSATVSERNEEWAPRKRKEIAKLLLGLREFLLQEHDLLAAIAAWSPHGHEQYLEMILERLDILRVKKPLLVTAVKPSTEEADVSGTLLQRHVGLRPKDVTTQVARNQDSLRTILGRIRYISLATIQHLVRTVKPVYHILLAASEALRLGWQTNCLPA